MYLVLTVGLYSSTRYIYQYVVLADRVHISPSKSLLGVLGVFDEWK